jgi:hypothetical protein
MVMYNDNDYKFIAVLNGKIDTSKLMNALGHMTAGLVSLNSDLAQMKFLEYVDADGGKHPAISHYPFIVLKADNSNQIRTLRNLVMETGILYNDFTASMLGASAQDQLDATKSSAEKDLEYFGICLFGPAEKLNPMTKKFSLFR